MDFAGQIIVVYIEEDNVQRAYFRIRPLLTEKGAISPEEVVSLPDEGFLRVVPDKNEQHTFKDRMREIGPLCLLNLKDVSPDANKIRSNKNYAPQKGETNQFIVYSDAVQSLPPEMVYEIVSVDDDQGKVRSAMTPQAYARVGGKITGPFSRATGLPTENSAPLPPDSEGLYVATLPDGQKKLFYWPGARKAQSPVAAVESEEARAPLSAPAFDEETPPTQDAQDRQLSGTPLYRSVAKRPVQPRAFNSLSDVVERQVRAQQSPEPQGAILARAAKLKQVDNPVDLLKSTLSSLWTSQDSQRQAVGQFLSMPGVEPLLTQALTGRGSDAVVAAMHAQMQDLEAERLSTLMQVDKAKQSLAEIMKNAVECAEQGEKAALEKAKKETELARAALDKIEKQRVDLIKARDEALQAFQAARAEREPSLTPQIGASADTNQLITRVMSALRARGLICSKDDAINLLTLYALSPAVQVVSATVSDAFSASRALCDALGGAIADANDAAVTLYEGGDAPAFALSACARPCPNDVTQLIAAESASPAGAVFSRAPWPVAVIGASDTWEIREALPACSAVKASCVRARMLEGENDRLTPPVLEILARLSEAMQKSGCPIPQSTRSSMLRFIAAASQKMEGGIAAALDFAACDYLLPLLRARGRKGTELAALSAGLPRLSRLLEAHAAD